MKEIIRVGILPQQTSHICMYTSFFKRKRQYLPFKIYVSLALYFLRSLSVLPNRRPARCKACCPCVTESQIFSVFMWRRHIRKLKITFPSEISVPSDERPYRTLTFHNVLARQGSSFCNRARLNFRAVALRDTKVAAQAGCRVGQKMSYRFSFC